MIEKRYDRSIIAACTLGSAAAAAGMKYRVIDSLESMLLYLITAAAAGAAKCACDLCG